MRAARTNGNVVEMRSSLSFQMFCSAQSCSTPNTIQPKNQIRGFNPRFGGIHGKAAIPRSIRGLNPWNSLLWHASRCCEFGAQFWTCAGGRVSHQLTTSKGRSASNAPKRRRGPQLPLRVVRGTPAKIHGKLSTFCAAFDRGSAQSVEQIRGFSTNFAERCTATDAHFVARLAAARIVRRTPSEVGGGGAPVGADGGLRSTDLTRRRRQRQPSAYRGRNTKKHKK